MAARKNNLTRCMNPTPTTGALLVLGGIAALGLGAWAYKSRKTWTKMEPSIHDLPEGYLSGVFTPGATLGAAPMILSDIKFGNQPFYLNESEVGAPIGYRRPDGEITFHSSLHPATLEDLGSIVTNIHGEMAYPLYDFMILQLSQSPTKTSFEAAQQALVKYRPKVEWYSPGSFAGDSPEAIVLHGARILGELARQNLVNKGIR